jgi:predicted nucleic acid-binding protein
MTKEDYSGLRTFTEKTYKDALKNNVFNKSNHDSKLQMLTFLVNALFKLKEYKLSLSYAEELRKAMMEYDKMLEKKYEFFYHNTLVINYSVIDIDKAISLLLDMKNNIKKNKMTFYDIFTYINLALCYYKKNRFDDAIKQLITMKTQEVFKNADEHLRLKIDIAEQIIRFEINDFDIIDYRVNQIRREFKKLLLQEEAQRENEMLKLIVGISKSPDYYAQKKWQQVAKNIMKIETDIEEFIDYNEWYRMQYGMDEKQQEAYMNEKLNQGKNQGFANFNDPNATPHQNYEARKAARFAAAAQQRAERGYSETHRYRQWAHTYRANVVAAERAWPLTLLGWGMVFGGFYLFAQKMWANHR